jgi:protocatechuate 3,4-dioxygenase alpha subunit
LINSSTEEKQIFITGKIYDGEGNAIHDAMIELWQADENGNYQKQYKSDGFTGFGRLGTGTEENKSFTFKTIKPGAINDQAPHINVILFMRGSLHALYTRIYFDDEQNNNDLLLLSVDAERRNTLIAKRKEKEGKTFYHFDIYMQGEKETVFFDI